MKMHDKMQSDITKKKKYLGIYISFQIWFQDKMIDLKDMGGRIRRI